MTTLVVNTTTDYTQQTLSGVDNVAFGIINDFVLAIFSFGQFDGVQIAANANFDSGPAYNHLLVNVGGGSRIDASAWTFSNWEEAEFGGFGDVISLEGSLRDDTIIGSIRNDQIHGHEGDDIIRAGEGNDLVVVTMVDGSDDIDGGSGVDRLNLWRVMASAGVTVDISSGGGGHDIGDGTLIANIESIYFGGTYYDDTVVGGDLNDLMEGGDGNDVFDGRGGTNGLFGHNGNDTIICSGTNGEFSGGGGNRDTLVLDRSASTLSFVLDLSGSDNTTLADGNVVYMDFERLDFHGGSAADQITGGRIRNDLLGGGGNDWLTGQNARDVLAGNGGDDVLIGGNNGDWLAGGAGDDVFAYRSAGESTTDEPDLIRGFASGDIIDLSAIDAIPGSSDDDFTFIGTDNFGAVAGELRVVQSAGNVLVEADTTGDGIADLTIILRNAALPGADAFIL